MDRENLIEIVKSLKIAKIISFNITYKEYDIEDEPTMTINYEKDD